MQQPIHHVQSFRQTAAYELEIHFQDGMTRRINFEPILESELFGPLRDASLFAQVKLDPEARILVWPSGADFDSAILHDWPEHEAEFRKAAKLWKHLTARSPPSVPNDSALESGESGN